MRPNDQKLPSAPDLKKNKSLLVNVILVITYWHHEREKHRKWWALFSWSSSSHRDSPSAICPLPGAQVTQAAFEDLRDIWRDTFDPGRYLLLGWYFWYMEITAALVMILLILEGDTWSGARHFWSGGDTNCSSQSIMQLSRCRSTGVLVRKEFCGVGISGNFWKTFMFVGDW